MSYKLLNGKFILIPFILISLFIVYVAYEYSGVSLVLPNYEVLMPVLYV